ncbi:MAG: ABC transporter permease [Spirochaetales bacterium]|nr:ABC transporter permease [Spirochaetales bacterium]
MKVQRVKDKTKLQKFMIVGVLLVLLIVLTILTPEFLTYNNITNVLRQTAAVILAGCAVTLLMISGNFDLSIGSIMAISGTLSAIFVTKGLPLPLSIVASILIGSLIGLLNGFLVVVMKVPSIIATLGTMYSVRGIAWVITEGASIHLGLGKNFTFLGRGFVGPIPLSIFITAIVFLIFFFIQHKTLLGKYAYAIGGNRRTALLSGVNIYRVGIILYILVGTMAGFSGTLMASRLGVGNANIGVGFEFDVVVAVVLGGTSLDGGEGSIFGMVIGALIVGFIGNGLNLMGVHSFYQDVVKGIVLVGAVLLDRVMQARLEG